jgi:hypothetical protein
LSELLGEVTAPERVHRGDGGLLVLLHRLAIDRAVGPGRLRRVRRSSRFGCRPARWRRGRCGAGAGEDGHGHRDRRPPKRSSLEHDRLFESWASAFASNAWNFAWVILPALSSCCACAMCSGGHEVRATDLM